MLTEGDKEIDINDPPTSTPKRSSISSNQSTYVDGGEKPTPTNTDNTAQKISQDSIVADDSNDTDVEKNVIPILAQDSIKAPEVVEIPNVPISPSQPPPIPNGGFRAWLQVLGSFFLFFNTWGLINAYGAFQTYYMADLLKHESASNIAWIGSVQAFLILFVGSVAGPIFDAGHFNFLLRLGGFCLVLGLMLTSLGKTLWQLALAQGILTGFGGGCLFLPSVAIIPQYFTTRKSLATGLASSGSSLGGVLYPIIFHRLQPRIGFPWATRVCGFICLATVLVPVLVMSVRVRPPGRRKLIQIDAYRDVVFSVNQIAGFFAFVGLFAPFFYLESYSLSQPQDNPAMAFYLLPLILAGSFLGRIVPNFFADKTGPFAVLVPSCLISCILSLSWITIKSTNGLIAFAVLFGFFTGSLVSVTPLTVVAITKDLRDLGTRMGMFMAVGALATLIGAPTLGAILNDTHSYLGVQIFCGVCLATGALLWIPVYFWAGRLRRLWVKEKEEAMRKREGGGK